MGVPAPRAEDARRDARARACEDAAAERRARRVVHHGDGLYVSGADGRNLSTTRDHEEPPEAEAPTRAGFAGQPQLGRTLLPIPVSLGISVLRFSERAIATPFLDDRWIPCCRFGWQTTW